MCFYNNQRINVEVKIFNTGCDAALIKEIKIINMRCEAIERFVPK